MFNRFAVRTCARTLFQTVCSVVLLGFAVGSAQAQPSLSLSDAISRAVASSPNNIANAARLEGANASIRGAGFGPRATMGLDLEDFAGSRPYNGVNQAQTTAYYERTWERGGKRDARIGVAQAELDATRLRSTVRTPDLVAKVQGAWIDAAAAEAAIGIAEERLSVARRLDNEVSRRVSRALDPVFAGERAKAALAQARIARDQAQETARISRAALAAWWGGTGAFRINIQDFIQISEVAAKPDTNPDVALATAEREVADAGIRLAESGSYADPTFRVGVRHSAQERGVALMVGGAIPIGVESANRSNVDRAVALRRAADAEIALSQLDTRREFDQLTADRKRIASEITRIDAEVLPTAERAAKLVIDGYTRGGTAFTYLEMADAQRAVVDAHTRRVELLRQFHQDGARLDRLSGRFATLSVEEKK